MSPPTYRPVPLVHLDPRHWLFVDGCAKVDRSPGRPEGRLYQAPVRPLAGQEDLPLPERRVALGRERRELTQGGVRRGPAPVVRAAEVHLGAAATTMRTLLRELYRQLRGEEEVPEPRWRWDHGVWAALGGRLPIVVSGDPERADVLCPGIEDEPYIALALAHAWWAAVDQQLVRPAHTEEQPNA